MSRLELFEVYAVHTCVTILNCALTGALLSIVTGWAFWRGMLAVYVFRTAFRPPLAIQWKAKG